MPHSLHDSHDFATIEAALTCSYTRNSEEPPLPQTSTWVVTEITLSILFPNSFFRLEN